MEQVIWTEKYRPHTFDDIVGHEHIVSNLKHLVESNNLPHLVLYGAKNTGKRSTVSVLSREGDGIARVQGFVIFVPGTKVGDNVKIKVDKVMRRFAIASVAE